MNHGMCHNHFLLISLNGYFRGFIVGKRGLSQGDPRSPFLFTIYLEVLSRVLKRMSRSPYFGYHPKCMNLHITHLAYVDDLPLLSKGDVDSVGLIMDCLNRFWDVARLRVNLLKSNIYMAGVAQGVRHEIFEITGFSQGHLPIRYLGIPLASRRLKTSDYRLLVDAIASKINSWPRHSLSYAGKIELIRSVVQGVECFWLSILMNIIDDIYNICRKFIWPTKHLTISRGMFCKPKEDGGLGHKNLAAWNNA